MNNLNDKLFEQIIILDSIKKIINIKKNIELIDNSKLSEAINNVFNILKTEESKQDIDLFNIAMGKMILSQNNFSLK
jgi:hypothetical protein